MAARSIDPIGSPTFNLAEHRGIYVGSMVDHRHQSSTQVIESMNLDDGATPMPSPAEVKAGILRENPEILDLIPRILRKPALIIVPEMSSRAFIEAYDETHDPDVIFFGDNRPDRQISQAEVINTLNVTDGDRRTISDFLRQNFRGNVARCLQIINGLGLQGVEKQATASDKIEGWNAVFFDEHNPHDHLSYEGEVTGMDNYVSPELTVEEREVMFKSAGMGYMNLPEALMRMALYADEGRKLEDDSGRPCHDETIVALNGELALRLTARISKGYKSPELDAVPKKSKNPGRFRPVFRFPIPQYRYAG